MTFFRHCHRPAPPRLRLRRRCERRHRAPPRRPPSGDHADASRRGARRVHQLRRRRQLRVRHRWSPRRRDVPERPRRRWPARLRAPRTCRRCLRGASPRARARRPARAARSTSTGSLRHRRHLPERARRQRPARLRTRALGAGSRAGEERARSPRRTPRASAEQVTKCFAFGTWTTVWCATPSACLRMPAASPPSASTTSSTGAWILGELRPDVGRVLLVDRVADQAVRSERATRARAPARAARDARPSARRCRGPCCEELLVARAAGPHVANLRAGRGVRLRDRHRRAPRPTRPRSSGPTSAGSLAASQYARKPPMLWPTITGAARWWSRM